MKKLFLVVAAVALLGVATAAQADYTQGFEGTGYNFYADSGSSSGISTTVAHSGSHSAQFTLDATRFAYTRWKSEDLTSYGLTLKDVVASSWEMRTVGRSDLAPYFLFTIATPDTTQETLAIQFKMPSIADNTWTQNVVDRTTTTFHVTGDRTGLAATAFSASGTQGTLDALAATTYSGATKWGDFNVTYVRIGVGLWDAAQTYKGYADDVTVGSAASGAPVPEPMSILLGVMGLGSIAGFTRLRRK